MKIIRTPKLQTWMKTVCRPFIAVLVSFCLVANCTLPLLAGPGFPIKPPTGRTVTAGWKQIKSFQTFHTTLPQANISYQPFTPSQTMAYTLPRVSPLFEQVNSTAATSRLLFSRTGINTAAQLPEALDFWRHDVGQRANQLETLPPHLFSSRSSVRSDTETSAATLQLADLITDIAALGIYGSEQDVPLLLNLHERLASTQFATPVTAATARALLRLGAYRDLQTVAYRDPDPAGIWDGICDWADRNNIRLPLLPAERQLETPTSFFTDLLAPFGQVTSAAVDPSFAATSWYMQLGQTPAARPKRAYKPVSPMAQSRYVTPSAYAPSWVRTNVLPPLADFLPRSLSLPGFSGNFAIPDYTLVTPAEPSVLQKSADKTSWQRAGLYAASFVMGFELGQPIIASVGEALKLSLPENILVSVATFAPYALGSFWASHRQQKIGDKALLTRGLWLLGASLAAGTLGLGGLDGHFSLWANPKLHFYSILSVMTLASLGSTMMHCAVGPMMSALSRNAPQTVRERRTANTELGQAAGLLTSYLLPFIGTQWLGLDWSAPFLLSLPLVATAALGLHTLRNHTFELPRTTVKPALKTRKLKDNVYVKLFKEDKNLGKLVGGLALVNGIEASLNSGFLLMLPELTNNASSQYLWGLGQFALPFALGSFLGTRLLKHFPHKNMTISAAITAAGVLGAVCSGGALPVLAGSLALAELGLSSAYTLSFARSAKNPKTQGRVASLLVASTLSAAVMPFMLSSLAQGIIDAGWMSLPTALATTMIGLPGLLSLGMWRLFRKMENPRRPLKKK